MPGRLMAEHDPDRVNGAIVGRKKPGADSNLPNGVPTSYDASSHLDHGVAAHPASMPNGVSASVTDNSGMSSNLDRSLHDLPPEIAQITVNYQPLSKLLGRAAQECYNNLSNTITSLGEGREHGQVNGELQPAGNGPSNAVSIHKREQWFQFATTNRERFIKLWVLLQWSRHVDEVSKIIDLFAWMREQEAHYNTVDDMMGYLKRDMHPEKIPSPDLETALEILSTGQSSQMPDLQYLPLDPLSAPELLKILKTINTLLHIRLNLHENLPRHFRTFRIASGRATFTVSTEFELDLSIADDDPNSRFYFIDFRFLFTPSTEIPAGQLRVQLEARANEVLASSGLSGCYDFFHDFVLTHKLNILRRQAIDLNRTRWAGSLRIEQLHRSLVIQYWTDRPGAKSWIEIGVNSGKQSGPNGSRKRETQSHLAVKWDHGTREPEVEPIPESVLSDLDFESVLRTVVMRHINLILSAIGHGLETAGCSVIDRTRAEDEQFSLELPLAFSGSSILTIEPTVGRMVLMPSTAASVRYETMLNALKNPAEQAEGILMSFMMSETSATVRQAAARCNWVIVSGVDSKISGVFGKDKPHPAARASIFRPWRNSSWIIATLLSPVEEPTWWVARLLPSGIGKINVDDFRNIDFIPSEHSMDGMPGQTFFSGIEKLAIRRISFQANSDKLKRLAIPHTLPSKWSNHATASNVSPVILIQASALVGNGTSKSSFVTDQIALAIPHSSSFLNNQPTISYIVKGTMCASSEFLRLLTKWRKPDVVFDEHGAFALRIHSTLDAPIVIDLVAARLSSLCRLRNCLEILNSRNFKCTTATFEKISFNYACVDPAIADKNAADVLKTKSNALDEVKNFGASPEDTRSEPNSLFSDKEVLSAEVDFTPGHIAAKFYPAATNPLNHLRPFFTKLLNKATSHTDMETLSAFSEFTRALPIVLPVMRAISSLTGYASLHLRTLCSYRLVYARPRCAFTIRYQCARTHSQLKDSSWMWFIEASLPSPAVEGSSNEKLQTVLAEFWKNRDIDSAISVAVKLSAGIACTPETVERTLKELGNIVNGCRDDEVDDAEQLALDAADEQEGNAPAPLKLETAQDIPAMMGLGIDVGARISQQPQPTTTPVAPIPNASLVPVPPTAPAPAPTQVPAAAAILAPAVPPPPAPRAAAGAAAQARQQQQQQAHAKAQAKAHAQSNGPSSVTAASSVAAVSVTGVAPMAKMAGTGMGMAMATTQGKVKEKDRDKDGNRERDRDREKEKGKGKANAVVNSNVNANANSNSGNGPEVIMLDD